MGMHELQNGLLNIFYYFLLTMLNYNCGICTPPPNFAQFPKTRQRQMQYSCHAVFFPNKEIFSLTLCR